MIEASELGRGGGLGTRRAGDGREDDNEEKNGGGNDEDELGLFIKESGLDWSGLGRDLI